MVTLMEFDSREGQVAVDAVVVDYLGAEVRVGRRSWPALAEGLGRYEVEVSDQRH